MRTEARVGRPFVVPQEVVRLCQSAVLHIGEEAIEVEGDQPVSVPPSKAGGSQERLEVAIEIAPTIIGALEGVGCDPGSVSLVLMKTLPLLRSAQVTWRTQLSSLEPGFVEVDLRSTPDNGFLDAVAHGGRAWLTAYVVVDGCGVTGLYTPGAWLSRAKFTFGVGGRGFQFGIHPLDDPQYELGVPRKAATYLQIGGNVATSHVDDLEVAVYVNKDLLSRLGAIESPASAAITRRLEVEAIVGLLGRLVIDCRSSGIESWFDLEQVEGSVGAHLVRNLAALRGSSDSDGCEAMFNSLLGGELPFLRTLLEAEVGSLDAELRSLSPAASRGAS